jgi:hypothetical protein
MSTFNANQLTLAPLGAGDLIDRAVRLYRRHLFVLIRIAAPPVIVAAAGWLLCSTSLRHVFFISDTSSLVLYIFLTLLGIIITVIGCLFTVIVMGGSTRNLVAHLLRNDPVSARATYRVVRERFWGLFCASLIVLSWIFVSTTAAFLIFEVVFSIGFFLIALLLTIGPPVWISIIIGIIVAVVAAAGSLWVFFFIVGRLAYVPQVMLVEGRSVLDSVSRSFSLARGNIRRLMAMTLFTSFVTNSALMILVAPLYLYAYFSGVDPWNSTEWPAWYSIANSVVGPLSSILLTPVWMLGLSLLYLDERVRHEGYDIELMAAQQLAETPDQGVSSPFGPALSPTVRIEPPPPPRAYGRVLNLG